MQMVLFIGIQGSGKSSFYRDRFFRTHVRISLDMLKTLNRERLLFEACLQGKIPFVVDKMNLSREKRAHYIRQAKQAGFSVCGYFFQSTSREAIQRNHARLGTEKVPVPAILGSIRSLQPPSWDEGFEELHSVKIDPHGRFVVEPIAISG